jgi:glycosyltransferase involved in cell wall biosynthesis
MNILFLADPNSIHDVKWITYFTLQKGVQAFLLPRKLHWLKFHDNERKLGAVILSPIPDFSIVRFYTTILTSIRIRKIIVERKIDLINIHYAEPNALWSIFRWYFKVPIIITTLGTDVLFTIPESFKRRSLINYLVAPAYRLAFQQADWITCTSQTQIDSVKRFSGRTNELTIIRTGVDLKRLLSDTSHHFSLHDSRPFILFPRYIKSIYNHEFSLAAIALLPLDIKRNYKMVFVGKGNGDAAYQQQLETLMSAQPDVKFEFIGKQSQDEIFELYKRASLVVMTPISDGSPVSGMEALLCGAKLILGPLNYDPGIFSKATRLKQWDPVELAETILNSLTSPESKPELTEELKRSMDRNFNMEKMMEIYEKVYNEACRAKHRGSDGVNWI